MSARWTTLAVVVPLLGLAVLVGRAEYASQHGSSFTIPIDGYDPRDLLHGRYLQYQYRLRWAGGDTCGPPDAGPGLWEGCCLCLTRDGADGFDPFVRQVHCSEVSSCDGALSSESMLPPHRYFAPEDRAAEIEAALRQYEASIELTCDPSLQPAVLDLRLDGRPWREVLGQ
jgi:hypothetical protein